jgi:hypothetical protein
MATRDNPGPPRPSPRNPPLAKTRRLTAAGPATVAPSPLPEPAAVTPEAWQEEPDLEVEFDPLAPEITAIRPPPELEFEFEVEDLVTPPPPPPPPPLQMPAMARVVERSAQLTPLATPAIASRQTDAGAGDVPPDDTGSWTALAEVTEAQPALEPERAREAEPAPEPEPEPALEAEPEPEPEPEPAPAPALEAEPEPAPAPEPARTPAPALEPAPEPEPARTPAPAPLPPRAPASPPPPAPNLADRALDLAFRLADRLQRRRRGG